jgi:adenine C2-methylase RlmN of 23S rRNA A2503 and tRNA A37
MYCKSSSLVMLKKLTSFKVNVRSNKTSLLDSNHAVNAEYWMMDKVQKPSNFD